LLFFPRGGEEDIVEYEAITGRVRIEVQVRRGVTDEMLVVFRIVSAEKCEGALAEVAVDVSNLILPLHLPET
jgi:hypothetical protein